MRSLPSLLMVASLGVAAIGAVVIAAPAAGAVPASGAASPSAPGTYVAVRAFRAVDTRTGALGNHKGAVAHGGGISAAIGGHGGVPKSGVAAVAVTITALSPTAAGSLVAYAVGTTRPGLVRNVQYAKGRSVAAAAIVRTSASGRVAVVNMAAAGSTHIVVDVAGYYVGGAASGSTPGVLHTVAPTRAFPLSGTGSVAPGRASTAPLGGHGGLPSSGVGSVEVLLSVVAPARSGRLIAYAAGATRPTVAAVQFAAGASTTQFAIVPTDSRGRISVYNSATRTVRVTVDVLGYTVGGVVTTAGTLQAGSPARVVNGVGFARHVARSVTVAGHGGVPSTNVAAVLVTITVTSAGKSGAITAWQAGTAEPGVTDLMFAPGQVVSDLAIVPVSSTGKIAIRNVSAGSTKLFVDVTGYVASSTLAPPAASTSRYLGDLTDDVQAGIATMSAHGCADAQAGSSFVLLDVGTQSVTGPELSTTNPGVLLAHNDSTVRLGYADLVTVLDSYLTGFAACQSSTLATIAVGTNNSGAFSGTNAYPAADRGTAWADQVVSKLRATAPNSIVLVGANDIENGAVDTDGFDNDVTNAQEWETAYLAATNAKLIYNGSANGCSSTFEATGGTCQDGWTMQQFYGLAHHGTQIEVLPQVFVADQAGQWANIDATGDATGKGQLTFAGTLTEHALDVSTYTPAQGWTALVQALSRVVTTLAVPAATDLVG